MSMQMPSRCVRTLLLYYFVLYELDLWCWLATHKLPFLCRIPFPYPDHFSHFCLPTPVCGSRSITPVPLVCNSNSFHSNSSIRTCLCIYIHTLTCILILSLYTYTYMILRVTKDDLGVDIGDMSLLH